MRTYCVYHLHSDLSLLDSTTNFKDYVDLAVAQGMTAIASTEHGLPRSWVEKKMYCDEKGIKFIHGVEIYLTESLEPKVRDNYHTILLAKNQAGVHELNRLIELSSRPDHMYYNNHLTFDEFLDISPDIIKISACLASPLRRLPPNHERYLDLLRHYDYLEVQPHDNPDQAEYNQKLMRYSQRFHIPLIAGTDTHSLNEYKDACRDILMWRKEQFYPGESGLNLTWYSYNALVDAFDTQGALPKSVYLEAIENTNVMADSIEPFELDKSIKYPILYGSRENDAAKFREMVWQGLDAKLAAGIIPREQEAAFRAALEEELRVFEKLGMSGFMLVQSELCSWCRNTGKYIGPARGSVGGSRAAYVTDIIDLNPEQWHTNFARFCNENRTEIGDIDTDVVDVDRPDIFRYIEERFGAPYTGRVAAYGTIQSLAFIDDCGGGLATKWEWERHPEKFGENRRMKDKSDIDPKNPFSPARLLGIKSLFKQDEAAAKARFPDLFQYYDGMVGTRISQSVHPAGIVISPLVLDEEYGVFHKDGDRCLLLNMDELHEVGAAKFDFLILKTVTVIRDCYAMMNQTPPKMHEINWNDQRVWASMARDANSIFQFESDFAAESMKKFKPKSIFDLSLVTACLRPSGASYRDQLLAHIPHRNPSALIDQLLKDNNGYLVYQEDIIAFLQQVCGLSGSYADTVRRGIARKKPEILEKALPQILDGYCNKSDHPRDQAEKECNEFLKIIEDASSYMFGYNHSIAYCLLSYMCGYLRYYHPLEWIAAFMKNAANDDDIKTGKQMARDRGIVFTRPEFGQDNRTYFIDHEHKSISDSIASIKGVGEKDAEAILKIYQGGQYSCFADVLAQMILADGALNRTVISILIISDYFRCFGSRGKLLHIYQEAFAGPHKLHKNLKQSTFYERVGWLGFEEMTTDESDISIPDLIAFEVEHYGEPVTVLPDMDNTYVVLDVDTRYSPKITMYNLTRGTKGMMKVRKPYYQKNELSKGNIIEIVRWHPEQAFTFANGQRQVKPGVTDLWLDEYKTKIFDEPCNNG